MKSFFLTFLFSSLVTCGFSQMELKVVLNDTTSIYEVYLKSSIDLNAPLNLTNSGQVTLTMPTGGFSMEDLINKNGDWDICCSYVSPIENTDSDYWVIILRSPHSFEYINGQEILLFTFRNKGVCTGEIALVEPDDPFVAPNSVSAFIGNLFTILGVGPTNAISGFYAQGRASCLNQNLPYLQIVIKALLQGPTNRQNPPIMKDELRRQNLIPLKSPYPALNVNKFMLSPNDSSDNVSPTVLHSSDEEKAIVDWVFLELRDSLNTLISTNSALIRRDGQIVDVDGKSPVGFYAEAGDYHLVVKHRNHLGVMTAAPIPFAEGKVDTIDFTNISTPTYGNFAQREINGRNYLWAGDANMDGKTIFVGRTSDNFFTMFDVLSTELNPNRSFNFIKRGDYFNTDLNMDGQVRIQGPNNEIDDNIFFNVFSYPTNTSYFPNLVISEQVPPLK